jgi:DNA-binding beta-propeller fold protein YncE/lysophospholipase L1-like esterase
MKTSSACVHEAMQPSHDAECSTSYTVASEIPRKKAGKLRRDTMQVFRFSILLCGWLLLLTAPAAAAEPLHRYLYVVTPGIRDYLEFGGAGILVFDIDNGHRFVKRIATTASQEAKPDNIKGVCADAASGRLFFTTRSKLYAVDLVAEKTLWEKAPPNGTDRMSITPDGKLLYVPSFEKDTWNVIDAASGDLIKPVETKSGAHNTVVSRDGQRMYLGGLRSPLLFVAETKTHEIVQKVGPLSGAIRPFTVNGARTRAYVCVNELLGFEIADLTSEKKLHRAEVTGFKKGTVKRHGCPSHGIGLTPDEREVWVVDAANQRVHVFDNTVEPPKQKESIALREQPGWITFSLDGKFAYPSTGEVIDTATKKIVAALADEKGREVHSEKMVEIHFRDGKPVANGDQFGVGRVVDSRQAVIETLPELHLIDDQSATVHRESLTPIQFGDKGPPRGRLAFPAGELTSVKSASGERTFEIGTEVKLDKDGQTLLFSAETKPAFIKERELFPPKDAPNSYRHRVGNADQNLLYGPGRWFHDRQVEVTYERHAVPDPAPRQPAEKLLPKTLARLRAGQGLTIGISGDSISFGHDASALVKAPPNQPPYPALVAAQLQASYQSPVTLKNRAIAGWSIAHGVKDAENLLAEKPQLVIVAYGMNDVGRKDPAWFKDETKQLLDKIRAADSEIEVILVASMLGHKEWIHTPREMFSKYRDALAELVEPGVALADLTQVWEDQLKSKHDLDLTGNGLNHPNDYGHRLYARTILDLLVN